MTPRACRARQVPPQEDPGTPAPSYAVSPAVSVGPLPSIYTLNPSNSLPFYSLTTGELRGNDSSSAMMQPRLSCFRAVLARILKRLTTASKCSLPSPGTSLFLGFRGPTDVRDISELPARASSRTLLYVKGAPIPSRPAPSPRFIHCRDRISSPWNHSFRRGWGSKCSANRWSQEAGISSGQATRVAHVLGFASSLLHTL